MTAFRKVALILSFIGFSSQLEAVQFPPTPMCPMVYEDGICRYENFVVADTNRCFARIALIQKLKMAGVDYDPDRIQCYVGAVAMKRAAPACGVVPTTTSCTVTVKNQVWQETAESCESPIPGLLQQLAEAGIDSTEGLTAVCQKEQLTGTTEFTIAL
jgi:hypothetical protein